MRNKIDKTQGIAEILYGGYPDKGYTTNIKMIEINKKKRGFIMKFFRWVGNIDLFGVVIIGLITLLVVLMCLSSIYGKQDEQQYICTKTEKNGKIQMTCKKKVDDGGAIVPVFMPVIIR